MSKDEDIRARVTPEIREQLEAIAAARGESLSIIVREAVRQYLTAQAATSASPVVDKAASIAAQAGVEIASKGRGRAKARRA